MRLHHDVTIHPTRSGGVSLRRGSRRVPAPQLTAHEIELVRIWCGEVRPASNALVDTIRGTGMSVTGFEQFVTQCSDSGLVQAEIRPLGDGLRLRSDQPLRLLTTVGIVGLDAIGMGIALGLAQSGVGHLRLQDRAPVTSADARLGWYGLTEIGSRREQCATSRLRSVSPETQITTGDVEGCDLIIIVSPSAVAAHSSAAFISDGIPHFAVCVTGESAEVGPVVVPGLTACLHCINLHQTEALLGKVSSKRRGNSRHGLGPTGRRHNPEISMILTAVAHGVSLALRTIDDSPPPDMVTATSPQLGIAHQGWIPHQDCGCMEFAPVGRTAEGASGGQI